MTISFQVEGNHFPVGRVRLPFHSLNVALSGDGENAYGFPTRTLIEINSPETGIGKSTFTTDIASRISQALGNLSIAYLDLEGQDEDTILNTLENSGFNSTLNWVTGKSAKKEDNSDEKLLEALEDSLWEEPPCIGILDSIAAISPTAEVQGDIGDANMGRRSFSMAQFTRRITRALRSIEIPTVLFLLNHQYEKIGTIGMAKQYTSPGGEVKKNLEKLRIQMKVPWVDYISSGDGKKEGRWENGWILEGKVEKNRSGAKSEVFQVFVRGGQGVHVGMSAVIDCLASGIAEVKTAGKVVMDGQDFGSINKIVENKIDDKEFFVAFQNALKVEQVDNTVSEDE